jgi:hypothetical protein
MRCTAASLAPIVDRVTRTLGLPTEGPGSLHLSRAYGGVALHQITSGTATRDVLNSGHVSAPALRDMLWAYLRGIEDGVAAVEQSTADRVALALGRDGTRWHTETGEPFAALVARHGGITQRRSDSLTQYRVAFPDGSALTCNDVAWDVGFLDCWCYRGLGHGCRTA